MQLSQEQKTFSQFFFFFFFFFAFLESILNLDHFQKTDDPLSWLFPKLRTPKNVIR